MIGCDVSMNDQSATITDSIRRARWFAHAIVLAAQFSGDMLACWQSAEWERMHALEVSTLQAIYREYPEELAAIPYWFSGKFVAGAMMAYLSGNTTKVGMN